jgi:hypothetical protein
MSKLVTLPCRQASPLHIELATTLSGYPGGHLKCRTTQGRGQGFRFLEFYVHFVDNLLCDDAQPPSFSELPFSPVKLE